MQDNPDVNFNKIEGTQNRLPREFQRGSLPYVLLIPKNKKKSPVPYAGPITSETLQEFVESNLYKQDL